MPPKYIPKPQELVLDFLESEDRMRDVLYVEGMDALYQWQGGWYKHISDKQMAKELYAFCLKNHSDVRMTRNFIVDLVSQLKWQVLNTVDQLPNHYICFRDCLLNTETWKTEKHNRDKISIFYLPYTYKDLPDEHPAWDKFLATSLVDREDKTKEDNELKFVVQEMFGDFLLPNLKSEAAYFLVGGGANGKSVMLDIATKIIGSQFISSMSIETLTTDKFSAPSLIGMRVNLSNEDESKFIKADKFKALVTGDTISAERKFGDRFDFRPTCKFVFASNKIPTFSDLNFGTMRRVHIIPFNQRFDKHNPLTDKTIRAKIMEELPAIVKWAITGAQRLQENDYEHSPSVQMDSAKEDFQGDISSAVLFFRENYVVDSQSWTSNTDLYGHYKAWCEEVGKKPFAMANFGKDLMTSFPELENKVRRVEGNQTRGKTVMLRNYEDEHNLVEGANTDGISIDEIPI